MKSKVADGIYRDQETGRYYERPWIRGRRTWRRLDGHTLKLARESLARRRADVGRAALGLARDPYKPAAPDLRWVFEAYRAAGCPDRRGRPRAGAQLGQELSRLGKLQPFWSRLDPDRIDALLDPKHYFGHRQRDLPTGKGGRAVDLEINTLSNVLHWARSEGLLDSNPFTPGVKKFRTAPIRHCRDVAPHTAEEVHQLAAHLFEDVRSQALGWQLLLEAYTGCRTSEILRLRWDAAHRSRPGYIEGDWLWLARAKGGVNPFALIHPALAQCLAALRQWRQADRRRANPHFIPGYRAGGSSASPGALTHALRVAGPLVLGRPITSHGLRAFYVTVRRSQGAADAQIAAEIGDKSGAEIIVQTYGNIPPNWQGQAALDWLPKAGPPAWAPWGHINVVALQVGGRAEA